MSEDGFIAIVAAADSGTGSVILVLKEDVWSIAYRQKLSSSTAHAVSFGAGGKIFVAAESTGGTTSLSEIDWETGTSSTTVEGLETRCNSLLFDRRTGKNFAVMGNGNIWMLPDGVMVGNSGGASKTAAGMLGLTTSPEGTQDKVRIFVGSRPGLNDRWDSGEIESTKTAALYGGGDNLVPGQKYWVSISIHLEGIGWSKPFQKEFIVPLV